VINALADRLPLRIVFLVTSGLLFVMAIKFVGDGLHGLQQQLYLPATAIRHGDWLAVLGFNPTWEAVAVQLAIVAMSVVTLVTLTRRDRPETLLG
jgi:high-affinity iron transporter